MAPAGGALNSIVMPQGRSIRERALELLRLLASAEEQLSYERTVSIAQVPGELFSFIEEFFQPKSPDFVEAFTDAELRQIAHLYGLTVEASLQSPVTVAELHKNPQWRRAMKVSAAILAGLRNAA